MTVIYLSHSFHGRKIASMEAEALHDEMNGWVRYNPNDPPTPLPNQVEEVPTNKLRVKRQRTTGSD